MSCEQNAGQCLNMKTGNNFPENGGTVQTFGGKNPRQIQIAFVTKLRAD